eukprot:g44080.t1
MSVNLKSRRNNKVSSNCQTKTKTIEFQTISDLYGSRAVFAGIQFSPSKRNIIALPPSLGFFFVCRHGLRHFASANCKVAILTRRPEDWKEEVTLVNEDLGWLRITEMTCKPDIITSDPAECIPQSDIVWIAGVPIHHNPELLTKLKPFLKQALERAAAANTFVHLGSICTYGGFNWVCRKYLGDLGKHKSLSLFGTQLIPWCCGTKEYGKVGVVFGAKRMLRIVTPKGEDKAGVKALLQPILRQNLRDADFLSSTLWPNNPSLHPPILYGLFKDWDGKTPYNADDVPLRIYKEMTDASAKCVAEVDKELNAIVDGLRKKFPKNKFLQLNYGLKECILENYEDQVGDPADCVTCIRSNTAFGKHNIPYQKVETKAKGGKRKREQVVPIIKHKFFETDLPFGLLTWRDIADLSGTQTPMINDIILWNQKLIEKEYLKPDGTIGGKDTDECILPSRWGITVENGLNE